MDTILRISIEIYRLQKSELLGLIGDNGAGKVCMLFVVLFLSYETKYFG